MSNKMNIRMFRNVFLIVCCLLLSNLYGQKYVFNNYNLSNNLTHSSILTMYQDNYGYLWIGTLNGLSRYDGNDFEVYNPHNALASTLVSAIYHDQNNKYWFGHFSDGITVIDGKSVTYLNKDNNLPSVKITSIAGDKNGKIWIGTLGNGIFVGDIVLSEDIKFEAIDSNKGLSSNNILDISFFNNQIWAATDTGLCIIKNISDINALDIQTFTEDNSDLSSNNLRSITIDHSNNIWMGSEMGLINVARPEQETDDYQFLLYFVPNEQLGTNAITKIACDHKGNIWGCRANGAFRFDGVDFTLFKAKNSSIDRFVNTVISDNEGNIWFGSNSNGVYRFRSDKFMLYDKSAGLVDNHVRSIVEDNAGNIWFATAFGISVLRNGGFKNYTTSNGLIQNDVSVLFKDSNGNIWVGSYHGKGLAVYSAESNSFETFTENDGLLNNSVQSINEDSDGNIYAASNLAKGISKLTYNNGNYSITQLANNETTGGDISVVHSDKKMNIWLGTINSGLYKYDGKSFNQVMEDEIDNVISMTHDSRNHLWICNTEKKLIKYTGQKCTFYDLEACMYSSQPDIHFLVGMNY